MIVLPWANTDKAVSLQTELQTYEDTREQLLRERGKYVLIQGCKVLGVYVAYEDALKAGYEKAGKDDFLVKKIEATETVHRAPAGSAIIPPTTGSASRRTFA